MKMPNDMWEQINRLLENRDRVELEAKYDDAQRRDDWKSAHDCLLELACRTIRAGAESMAEATRQQRQIAQEAKKLEARIAKIEASL